MNYFCPAVVQHPCSLRPVSNPHRTVFHSNCFGVGLDEFEIQSFFHDHMMGRWCFEFWTKTLPAGTLSWIRVSCKNSEFSMGYLYKKTTLLPPDLMVSPSTYSSSWILMLNLFAIFCCWCRIWTLYVCQFLAWHNSTFSQVHRLYKYLQVSKENKSVFLESLTKSTLSTAKACAWNNRHACQPVQNASHNTCCFWVVDISLANACAYFLALLPYYLQSDKHLMCMVWHEWLS